MRGVMLFVLAIIILSVPIQAALAHEDDRGEEAEFSLHAVPTKLTVHRGESVSSIINLRMKEHEGDSQDRDSQGGNSLVGDWQGEKSTGQINLTLTWDNRVPYNTSYSFKPASIEEDQSSILTFVTHLNSTIGNFHFHVWATIGKETEGIRMTLKIKQAHTHGEGEEDFTLSAYPLNVTTTPGGNVSSTIIVNSLRGFDSPVNLMVTWERVPAGVSAHLQPNTLTPSSTSNLTITTSTTTPVGLYGFEIIGVSGDIVHESPDMWLNVSTASTIHSSPAKDFTLKITPTSVAINPGEAVTYNLTLGAVNGFNQQVSLSLTPSTLQGATIAFSSTTPTPASPPVLVQLQIKTDKTIKNNTYGFTVTATNGTITHQVPIILFVLPTQHLSPPGVLLTLSLSKYNITVDQTITASGQLSPPQGLANTPILLIYTNISNVQWTVLQNVITNTTAGYTYDWTLHQAGTFLVRAIWNGNSTNSGALSNLAILTVMPSNTTVQSTPEFPWFWLAIAAVIIIGVATAVTLRIRKKPITTPVGP